MPEQFLPAILLLIALSGLGFGLVFLCRYRKLRSKVSALSHGLESFRDGDFSVRISISEQDRELGANLIALYNEVAESMRRDRQALSQRELLLDSVIQQADFVLVLTDAKNKVVHANLEAKKFLNGGRSLQNLNFLTVLQHFNTTVSESLSSGNHGVVEWEMEGELEGERRVISYSKRRFSFNRQDHSLYLLKDVTSDLSREEVKVWKKVIRVISHELNNSLAPISSMAHSGKMALALQRHEALEQILETIEERSSHLCEFLSEYAKFSKLPDPSPSLVVLADFFESVSKQVNCRLDFECSYQKARFDQVQIEQVLLNLVKNARESGSAEGDILLRVRCMRDAVIIRVLDRGTGMTTNVLQSSLVPFFTTKEGGSGVGLALCREIVDAHGGVLTLRTRSSGGLSVQIKLPL